MVTKTTEELDAMQTLIDQGELPKDAIKKHFEAEDRNVYGFDAKKDRKGNWIQQGLGSPGHETQNHFASIRRYYGDAVWKEAVEEIWKRDPKRAEALRLPKVKAERVS